MSFAPDLQSALDAASLVSFDIFDTAVLRRVAHPRQVFDLLAIAAKKRWSDFSLDIRSLRIEAERRTRERAYALSGCREFTLEQVYGLLVEDGAIDEERADALLRMECDLERRASSVNPAIFKIYRAAIESGKRVIFASDMYLPRETLEALLADAGYNAYERLFISHEQRASKREGNLFPMIVEALGCKPDDILHIGDDDTSDVRRAKEAGIRSHHYLRVRAVAEHEAINLAAIAAPAAAEGLMAGLSANRRFAERPLPDWRTSRTWWEDFGYEVAGPLFYGFARWLARSVLKDGPERVFFLARDGHVMQRAYERMRSLFGSLPPSTYLYGSRRAFQLGVLDRLEPHALSAFFVESETLPVSHYLARLYLSPDDITAELEDCGFTGPNDTVSPGGRDERLKALIAALDAHIRKLAADSRRLALDYLAEAGLLGCGHAALVDIGWAGSMQQALKTLLAENENAPRLSGYYLGTFPDAARRGHTPLSAKGYLCSFGEPQSVHARLLCCIPLFEFLHSAPHGSVTGYRRNGGRVEPVLGDNIIAEQNVLAERLQNGALAFVDDYLLHSRRLGGLHLSRDAAFAAVSKVVYEPSCAHAIRLGDLSHIDSFDSIEGARPLARPPGLGGLANPKALRRAYLQSHWKRGFMRRLTCPNHWTEK